ncbi:hypothetical protein [Streptomyces sp. P17]|uniref:hypothetical protein n=1 Tax=Streptomyces sp. P17 TaxID=3074716 RepID=UPI0028F3FB0A|nr:hypothetical protein [Streptomyces sp. P17]MDT9695045.1 hypothetical protein [Streptomyces sp. P17]
MNQPDALSRRTALASLTGAAAAGTAAWPAAAAPAAERHGRAVRFATFNASLNRSAEGALVADLSTPDNVQARNVAETIQRADPDGLLISEFDHDAGGTAVRLYWTTTWPSASAVPSPVRPLKRALLPCPGRGATVSA